MKTIEAITQRRAVKHFDAQHVMPEQDVAQLMQLTLLSPTAFNIQNWRFVLLRDPELRARVREASWGQAQVTDASLLVVLCADLKAWCSEAQRYWRDAPAEVREMVVPMIHNYYDGRPQVTRDEAMRSCGIAAQTLMLAAKAMGYDSCPMDGFDFDAVGRLIQLPPEHVIAMFVAIGKAVKPAWPRPGQLPLAELVVTDHF
ncbi:MAG: nitroreductase family protein [Desulfobulbaceae bacterium A2]|nr:MAG: nitroreductase family protein [Desulfobulbaceae bacterium A2]